MAGTDFTHLTNDELINGIKALNLPDYIRSKAYGVDVRETLAQMTAMLIQIAFNNGMNIEQAQDWAMQLNRKITNGQVTMGDLTQEVKEAMTGGSVAVVGKGAIRKENMTENAVSIETTDFATRGGKNLFNGDYLKGYAVVGGTEGVLTETDAGAFTAIVPVDSGVSYFVSKEGGNRFRLYTSAEDPLTVEVTLNRVYLDDGSYSAKVDIPQDHRYLTAYVSTGGIEPSRLQIEKGDSFTSWEEPNKIILNYADETIPNLALKPRFGFLNGYSNSVVIDYPNKVVRVGENANAYVQIGEKRLQIPEQTLDISANYSSALTINPETLELFSYQNHVLVGERLGLEKVILGYIDLQNRKSFLFGNYEEEKGSQNVEEIDKRKISLVGDIPAELFNVETKTFNPRENRDINTLYGVYDKLVDDYPHLVSRQLLSNDESGLPIYRYDVKPVNSVNGLDYPKIIMTVTHGHEVQAAYGTAFAVDELVRRSESDLLSRSIIDNAHLIIIPMPNPYGFNRGERPNYNGVDLARNYSAGWVENEDPIPGYGTHGSGPLSEIGTQVVDKILRDNGDALFLLDIHNYGGDPYSDTVAPLTWERSTNKWVETHISDKHIKLMGSKVRFGGYGLSKDIQLGRVNPTSEESIWQGQLIHQADYYGMDAIIIESMNTLHGDNTDDLILKYNTETVGNMLATILRVYGN